MAKKYSFIKRLIQSFPGLREWLATAFTLLPKPFSVKVYALLRRYVFRDNEPRLNVFRLAFEEVQKKGITHVNYFEFGVARGTSVIASYLMARRKKLGISIFAFDSFEGLPSSEGDFAEGDMAYSERVFRRFIDKAGVPLDRVVSIPGFFNASLTLALKNKLKLEPSVAIFHNDSDLYESTKDVLRWIDDLALPGSVLIFDDWHSFSSKQHPENFGEQRAFFEWPNRDEWELLIKTENSNVAFVKIN